jgi:hypothetical protein
VTNDNQEAASFQVQYQQLHHGYQISAHAPSFYVLFLQNTGILDDSPAYIQGT